MICKIPVLLMALSAPGTPGFEPVEIPLSRVEEAAKKEPGPAALLEILKGDGPHKMCQELKEGDCATQFLVTPGQNYVSCVALPLADEGKPAKGQN